MKKFGYPMMINMKIQDLKDRLKCRHCFRAVLLNWGDYLPRDILFDCDIWGSSSWGSTTSIQQIEARDAIKPLIPRTASTTRITQFNMSNMQSLKNLIVTQEVMDNMNFNHCNWIIYTLSEPGTFLRSLLGQFFKISILVFTDSLTETLKYIL